MDSIDRASTFAIARAPGRLLQVAAVIIAVAFLSGKPALDAPSAQASSSSRPVANGVTYPGPTRGMPGSQTPAASLFTTSCNAQLNSALGTINGTPVMTGTAIDASTGCGTAVLPLYVLGNGRLTATFGVLDSDTSGQPAVVRVRVLDSGSFSLYIGDVTARHGSPATIDVDVSHAIAVQFNFLKNPETYLYNVHLSGTARSLNPVAAPASGLPAGARSIDPATVSVSCNAQAVTSTDPVTVTKIGIPVAGSFSGTGCGQLTLNLPANTQGTLVLRYGADDKSGIGVESLAVSALDANGHLLRRALGLAAVGTGLQPLWVDLTDARSVQIKIDGGTAVKLGITGLGILPGRVTAYVTANRVQSGGSPNGSITVDPLAFASQCNSSVGTDDVKVRGATVFGGTYLNTYSCGAASLFFCCTTARGTFHALFAVPDTEPAGTRASLTAVVQDKNAHVLRRTTLNVSGSGAPAALAISVDGASTINVVFGGGSGLLFGLRLTGLATISEHIYPPTEPPVMAHGGVAINPADLALQCNATVSTDDERMVGDTALRQWALVGEACGSATLNLTGTHYPHHDFYAKAGIRLGSPPDTVAYVVFNVLDNKGKVLQTKRLKTAYSYGVQPVHLSLQGGSAVQIIWQLQRIDTVVVYAMTAA